MAKAKKAKAPKLMKPMSLKSIKSLVNRYGSAKIMLKLPKSRFKAPKAPKIRATKSRFKIKG